MKSEKEIEEMYNDANKEMHDSRYGAVIQYCMGWKDCLNWVRGK